ncbi:MAG: hypothetical protein HOI70_03255, partial [Opitutae bacterium]|nr:hypothetical protein [Opitutae bacterium]
MTDESSKYWINQNGENIGPYSFNAIRSMERSGELDLGDPACLVGEDEWLTVQEVLKPDLSLNQEDQGEDVQKIIMAKQSGVSFNAILTVILLLLLFVCGGLFMYLKLHNKSTVHAVAESDEQVEEEINFEDVVSGAILVDSLRLENGTMVSKDKNIPFSGWAKKDYPKGDKLNSLIKFEDGKHILAFSWRPNGDKCKETSLNNGQGILVEYFQSGGVKKKTPFRGGFFNGVVASWHESQQRSVEESYGDGSLHGQSISWHENGQKIKQVFYIEGMKSGPYSYWTKDGQKFEEGTYRNGKLDGRRILWSQDGLDRTEEFYENGELIPQVPVPNPKMVAKLEDMPMEDPVLANLLELADGDGGWVTKASAVSEVVGLIQERFKKSQIVGHEVFADLGIALFKYAKEGRKTIDNVKPLLEVINNRWGISIISNGEVLALSELPESVRFGPISWSKVEYAQEFLGSIQGASRDLVVGDLKKLFSSIGIELESETESIRRLVKRQIWEELSEMAEDAKTANLQFVNEELTFNGIVEKKVKKINPQGQSIFEIFED